MYLIHLILCYLIDTNLFMAKCVCVRVVCECVWVILPREGEDTYYTSPQSFIKFSYSLAFKDFNWILIGWLIMLSVQAFKSLIVIYRMGNFCIIIGDVLYFISHCLVLSDPCIILHIDKNNMMQNYFSLRAFMITLSI